MSEWLPTGAVIGFGMFLFGVVRADLKAMETRLREDQKASEARQREDVKELREKVDALPLKIVELLRQPVTPDR
ncbi:MAG: hypothetical protein F4Z73_05480 [Synechococcus sp. SB0668_bin_13]|nr:hypothetical protein [Synechococcus sp. SB0668_bin_13]